MVGIFFDLSNALYSGRIKYILSGNGLIASDNKAMSRNGVDERVFVVRIDLPAEIHDMHLDAL